MKENDNTLIMKFWFDEEREIHPKEHEDHFCKTHYGCNGEVTSRDNNAKMWFIVDKDSGYAYAKKVSDNEVQISLFLQFKSIVGIDKYELSKRMSIYTDKTKLEAPTIRWEIFQDEVFQGEVPADYSFQEIKFIVKFNISAEWIKTHNSPEHIVKVDLNGLI